MNVEQLKDLAVKAVDDMKAKDITVLDVRDKTSIADYLVIATGTSNRHLRSLATEVQVQVKDAGVEPLGCEGENDATWVLVDLGDVIVHLMLKEAREFYELEKLWSFDTVYHTRGHVS